MSSQDALFTGHQRDLLPQKDSKSNTPRTDSAPMAIPAGRLALPTGTKLNIASRGLSEDLSSPQDAPVPARSEHNAAAEVFQATYGLSATQSAPLRLLGAPTSPFSCASCLSSPDSDAKAAAAGAEHLSVGTGDGHAPPNSGDSALSGLTALSSSHMDLLDAVSKAVAQGLTLDDMISGAQKPHPTTQHGYPDVHYSPKPPSSHEYVYTGPHRTPGHHEAWDSAPAAHLLDSGCHGGAGSADARSDGADGCARSEPDGQLSQEQLLPSLLFSNSNTPPLSMAAAGAMAAPEPMYGAAAAAVVDPLSMNDAQMLSAALDKLRPDELDTLANLSPAEFEKVVVGAVAGLHPSPTPNPTAAPYPRLSLDGISGGGRVGGGFDMQQLQGLLGAAGASAFAQPPPQLPQGMGLPAGGLSQEQLRALLQSGLLPASAQFSANAAAYGGSPSGSVPPTTPNPLFAASARGLGLQSPVHNAGLPAAYNLAHLLAGTRPAATGEGSWEDLTQNVRDKVQSMIIRCDPHIKLGHFDGGVRHWLAQLTDLFGEAAALAGLSSIEQATNLAGVRNMRAFITTRLIDCFEQHVFQRDPSGYAARRLLPEQYQMLEELILSGNGLQWMHFDPKVLETIRDLGSLEYTRARLSRLSARELANVQNVPAYIFTLLSKRGKTAKQAAVAKGASEAALCALLDAAVAASRRPALDTPATVGAFSPVPQHTSLAPSAYLTLPGTTGGLSQMQRAHTLGSPAMLAAASAFSSPGMSSGTPLARLQESGVLGMRPQHAMTASRSNSAYLETSPSSYTSTAPSMQQRMLAAQHAGLFSPQQQQQVLRPQSGDGLYMGGGGGVGGGTGLMSALAGGRQQQLMSPVRPNNNQWY